MTIILCDGPQAPQSRGTVFLPIVAIGATPGPQPVETAAAETPEEAFYRLLVSDPHQQRPTLTWCASLAAAARWRSDGLASGDPWAHRDRHNVSPNEYARRAGCRLSDDYSERGNSIESLVAGSSDVAVVFSSLANSPHHADHIFGRTNFFRQQTSIGVSMTAGGEFGWYWCVMIAPCGK